MNLRYFFDKYRLIIGIIGLTIFTLVMGFLFYSLFFKPAPKETPRGKDDFSTSDETSKLPEAEKGEGIIVRPDDKGESGEGIPEGSTKRGEKQEERKKVQNIYSKEADSPASDTKGRGIRFYDPGDGKFYRIDEKGSTTLMSDETFYSVENVNWADERDKAIIEYPDGSNIIYDFDEEKQITIPKHWQDFDISANGEEIVTESMGMDPNNRWLITTDGNGANARPIEKLGENDNIVYPTLSPNGQVAAMYTKGVDFNRQKVYFVGKNNENFKNMIINGRGFEFEWSKKGDKLLYSVYSENTDMNPTLWTVNAHGEKIGTNRHTLGVDTWAHKCAFADNDTIYCGVPTELKKGSGIFPEINDNITDEIYKINVNTGTKKRMASREDGYTVKDISISEDGKQIYFTNKKDGNIYKINTNDK